MIAQDKGFSLIELLIVLVIIGILALMAYPTYQHYIIETRRTDGQGALMDLSAKMEWYFTEHNTYAGATLTNIGINSHSPEGYYTLSITSATATTFLAKATPVGIQTADTKCAILTINQLNEKSATGNGPIEECW